MPTRSPSVDVLRTVEEMDALGSEWAELEAHTPEANGFQSLVWCRTWLAAMQAGGLKPRLHLVTVRLEGRLVMLWPLLIQRRFGLALARWIGEPMTQYGDILAEPGAERSAWLQTANLAASTRKGIDLFASTRVRDDAALSAIGASTVTPMHLLAAPFVDMLSLGENAPDLARNKGLRRRAKILSALGSVVCEEVEDADARVEAVRLALVQKRRWLSGKGLVGVGFSDPTSASFLERMAHGGTLRAHRLLVAGEPAAIEIGFTHRDVYRSLIGSYDMRFAFGSPGHVLTGMVLERCRVQGLRQYDFLGPDDPYKRFWAGDAMGVGSRFEAVSTPGRLGAVAFGYLRPLAKQAQARLPKRAKIAVAKIISTHLSPV